MKAFISHNKADKVAARALAGLIIEQGEGVWFDAWNLRPGDSLVGGIEEGLAGADVFVLLWSEHAQQSNWVGVEMRATVNRRVNDHGLRIVPVMLDKTPLPMLVADYLGFDLSDGQVTLEEVAAKLTGQPRDIEVAQKLQARFQEIVAANVHPNDPFGHLICPQCGSEELNRSSAHYQDDLWYLISCRCGWSDSTQ